MELGYARVSTSKQDLTRQIDALRKAGVDQANIYVDKKSGATTERPGLQALLGYARKGDVIVVHTLDRLGRTVRDTLNLIHDLHQRGIGFRNLADPIRIDSTNPDDPMGQLAVVLLALFGQMERTYAVERAAHARTVATEKGRRTGRPSVVTDAQLAYATQLRDGGATIAEITDKTGLTRSTLYRHLPSRPPETLTADIPQPENRKTRHPARHLRPRRPDRRPVRPADTSPPPDGTSSRTAPISRPSGCTSAIAASCARPGTAPTVSPTTTSWWSAAPGAGTVRWSPAPIPAPTKSRRRCGTGSRNRTG